MLRFAVSPTDDMHIGDLKIALFNYIAAQQRNEAFIVRINNIDTQESGDNIATNEQETVGLLELFGLEYSQIAYQSQNFRFHSAMALDLLHKKKAFSCFCSDEWLEKKRAEADAANKAYSYDDACRNLPAELVIDNTAPFTVRIARPDAPIVLKDKVQGELTFEPENIDSFVIMNQDKTPTYNFAAAVDDMLSDISMIFESKKRMSDTPKQVHVRNALGYDKEIEYAHLTPIVDEDTLQIKELIQDGYLPEAILNYLILITCDTPTEIFTLQEALKWFSIEKIRKTPQHFDMKMLQHINKEHLKIMDATELSRYVGFADAEIGELAKIFLTEAKTTKELKSKVAPVFEPRNIPEEFTRQIALLRETIQKAPYFDNYDAFETHLIQETALEGEDLLQPLRILLINAQDGPDVTALYSCLKNYIGEIIKK